MLWAYPAINMLRLKALMFPVSAYLSHLWIKNSIIGWPKAVSTANITVAMGIPRVSAASAPAPEEIARDTPRIVPEIKSGGLYAPTEIAPIIANSRVAIMVQQKI